MVARRGVEPLAGEVCEFCGRPNWDDVVTVAVPDSAFLHPTDPEQDGTRMASACSGAHAQALIERGRRTWIAEQLWSAKLRRVSGSWNRTVLDLDEIAALAGLTPSQLRGALRWRIGRQRRIAARSSGSAHLGGRS